MLEGFRYGLPLPRRRGLPGPVILMYHGVIARSQDPELDRWAIPTAEFIRHLDFLRRHYRIVSMERLVEALGAGERPADWIVLTFDDGFTNVFTQARPLLRERGLPYAVALPAGLLGSGRTVWSLEVRLILHYARAEVLQAPLDDGTVTLRLQSANDRRQAAERLATRLISGTDEQRQRCVNALLEQLAPGEFGRLMEEYGELRLMTIEQARQMHTEGATIMGHGFLHARLSDIQSPEVLGLEIQESREMLRRELDAPVDFFVYPFGIGSAPARQKARAAGYRACLTSRSGYIESEADLLSLPRLHAECSLPHLQSQLARLGARPGRLLQQASAAIFSFCRGQSRTRKRADTV